MGKTRERLKMFKFNSEFIEFSRKNNFSSQDIKSVMMKCYDMMGVDEFRTYIFTKEGQLAIRGTPMNYQIPNYLMGEDISSADLVEKYKAYKEENLTNGILEEFISKRQVDSDINIMEFNVNEVAILDEGSNIALINKNKNIKIIKDIYLFKNLFVPKEVEGYFDARTFSLIPTLFFEVDISKIINSFNESIKWFLENSEEVINYQYNQDFPLSW